MISELDDHVTGLDAVHECVLQRRALLDAYQQAGWDIDELKDVMRVRTRFGRPTPKDILTSILERLNMARKEVSEMSEILVEMRAADESLVDC